MQAVGLNSMPGLTRETVNRHVGRFAELIITPCQRRLSADSLKYDFSFIPGRVQYYFIISFMWTVHLRFSNFHDICCEIPWSPLSSKAQHATSSVVLFNVTNMLRKSPPQLQSRNFPTYRFTNSERSILSKNTGQEMKYPLQWWL